MASELPLRKYIKVWIKKRSNNTRKNGTKTSATRWSGSKWQPEFHVAGGRGDRRICPSGGSNQRERANSFSEHGNLVPVTWGDLEKKYLDTMYPGHNLPPSERKKSSEKWGKSIKSMYAEKAAMKAFGRIRAPKWVHEIDSTDREKFIATRMTELPSPESIDSDLRRCDSSSTKPSGGNTWRLEQTPSPVRREPPLGRRGNERKNWGRRRRPNIIPEPRSSHSWIRLTKRFRKIPKNGN